MFSPILAGCEEMGLRVIDMRHVFFFAKNIFKNHKIKEANTVFAADAVNFNFFEK